MSDVQSPWETEQDTWEPETVPARNKVLWFICKRVKEKASKEQLLEDEVPIYIKENGLPLFLRWDVEGMIDWSIRKFRLSSNDDK